MGSSLEDFNADKAIAFWWADKACRSSQKKRKPYVKQSSGTCSSTAYDSESETKEANLLDDWDN